MTTGIAAGLLVFTGIWHATEWMMDGRRWDTWALVPVGLIYLILGLLLVAGVGGIVTPVVALAAAALGGTLAILRRGQMQIRTWVIWTFVLIDGAIVVALGVAFLS